MKGFVQCITVKNLRGPPSRVPGTCSPEINCVVPLFPKIKILISYVPCSPKIQNCLKFCSPAPFIFSSLFPCSSEINALVPLFPHSPERASSYPLISYRAMPALLFLYVWDSLLVAIFYRMTWAQCYWRYKWLREEALRDTPGPVPW